MPCADGQAFITLMDPTLFDGLINRLDVCFISSIDHDGFPAIKAMLPPRSRDGINTIFFSTNTSSEKVSHYRTNRNACVYFCDRPSFQGLALTGTMEVLNDPAYKEMLWIEGDERYYPLGITDPDYCVLRFTAVKGRYYNGYKTAAFDIKPPEYNV